MFTIGKCLCFFLLGLFFPQITFPIEKKTPQIVFLNGPSSSGKTTLAKQLQEKFSERFLYLSFDQIIEMMPEKVNSWDEFANPVGFSSIRSTDSLGKPVTHMQIGSFGKKMRDLFRVICVSIVRNGQSLIIDDVFFEKFGEKLWKEALQEFHVIWIGLHAPCDTKSPIRAAVLRYRHPCYWMNLRP